MKQFLTSILILFFSYTSSSQAGSPINSFGTSGSANTTVGTGGTTVDIAVQSDAKLVVAGYATVGSASDFALARFKTDGTLDITFNGTGKVSTAIGATQDYLTAIAVQSDGKIVAVGYCLVGSVYNIGLVRYNTDGSLDVTFSGDGKLTTSLGASASTMGMDVAVQGDGKIVVVGSYNNNIVVIRYNSDGSFDTSFDLDGSVQTSFGASTFQSANSVALQSDGKIVVGGSSQNQFALVRYNTDGSLDTSFDGDGKVNTTINASGSSQINSLAIQNDGSIVAAGRYSYYDFMTDMNANNVAVAKYSSSGAPQTSFDGDGKLTFVINSFSPIDEAKSVALQSDGKILLTGMGFTAARLNANGTFDNSFDGDGKITGTEGSAVKLWSNRIYIANWSGGLGVRAFQNDFTVLPVRLVAFTAMPSANHIEVSWQTATEKNMEKFSVERSSDGILFKSVGEVKAAGSKIENDYRFLDRSPLFGKSFYRLKMLDADKSFSYSHIISLIRHSDHGGFIQTNPVREQLVFQVQGSGHVQVQIIDGGGRTLKQESLQMNGSNSHTIDVRTLPQGQYFLSLQQANLKEVKPFLKQ